MNTLWKQFDQLTDAAYDDLVKGSDSMEHWDQAFQVFLQILENGRAQDPGFARELMQLDDDTDFEHMVCQWTEDYLDELDEASRYPELETCCRLLLERFDWKEEAPDSLLIQLSMALRAQGKNDEALALCEEWYAKEPDNLVAVSALILSKTEAGQLDQAELLVNRHLLPDTLCTEENEMLFMAAVRFCEAAGDTQRGEELNRQLESYEEQAFQELMEDCEDDEDDDDLFF